MFRFPVKILMAGILSLASVTDAEALSYATYCSRWPEVCRAFEQDRALVTTFLDVLDDPSHGYRIFLAFEHGEHGGGAKLKRWMRAMLHAAKGHGDASHVFYLADKWIEHVVSMNASGNEQEASNRLMDAVSSWEKADWEELFRNLDYGEYGSPSFRWYGAFLDFTSGFSVLPGMDDRFDEFVLHLRAMRQVRSNAPEWDAMLHSLLDFELQKIIQDSPGMSPEQLGDLWGREYMAYLERKEEPAAVEWKARTLYGGGYVPAEPEEIEPRERVRLQFRPKHGRGLDLAGTVVRANPHKLVIDDEKSGMRYVLTSDLMENPRPGERLVEGEFGWIFVERPDSIDSGYADYLKKHFTLARLKDGWCRMVSE